MSRTAFFSCWVNIQKYSMVALKGAKGLQVLFIHALLLSLDRQGTRVVSHHQMARTVRDPGVGRYCSTADEAALSVSHPTF